MAHNPAPRDRWFKSSPRNQFYAPAMRRGVFMSELKLYQVYVVQNPQGRFYIGLSEHVNVRVQQHNDGRSKWTRHRGPWSLVWVSRSSSLTEARKLEHRLKLQKGGIGFYKLTGLGRSPGS
jgi:predicted GIY-YIG superfamily endonuclease